MIAAVASCDGGNQHNQVFKGPTVTIIGLNVGDNAPMKPDGVIQIAFDRYLLPSTPSRQSVQIADASGQPLPVALAPIEIYDPVARTITLTRPQNGVWLTPGLPYKLRFPIAQGEDDTIGIRAIDRATLEPSQKLEYSFLVGVDPDGKAAKATAGIVPGEPLAVSFCKDVLPLFLLKCSAGKCHGSSDQAAASLVLETGSGVSHTAKNRVAQGANTGGISTRAGAEGHVFGVDMPIIGVDEGATVGRPGDSWLMYKLELAASPVTDAGAQPKIQCSGGLEPSSQNGAIWTPLAPGAGREPDDVEKRALSDYVLGREMPYPVEHVGSYSEQPLTFQERETIRMWIARGAHTEDCGGCAIGK